MKNSFRLFLDIHAIQNVPPSNINRDDTGSPKTAQYGGVTRARVSSQSWKRAMRAWFLENSEEGNLGIRSLNIVRYLADRIRILDASISEEKAMSMAEKTINSAGVKASKQKVKALFFLGSVQADALARAALAGQQNKAKLQSILNANPAIDIALFGRMVADDPSLNEDASAQVAHAISTHAIQSEFDFFTAVDDLHPEDNVGAGMLGTVEFNSSTLYRYANIALHELENQIGSREQAIRTARLFIEAFAKSMPTGKVNTFANQTLPQALIVQLRSDRPISLVSAFEEPVRSEKGYVNPSIQRMFHEMKEVRKFSEAPLLTLYIKKAGVEVSADGTEESALSELLDALGSALQGVLPEETGEGE